MKRNTHQKQIVRGVLNELTGQHPTVDQVYERVVSAIPTISKATVYRILNQLVEEGDMQKVQLPASADRYDDHIGPHYHLRCDGCGRFFDVDMPILQDLCERIPANPDFVVTGHDIVFTGNCAACAKKA